MGGQFALHRMVPASSAKSSAESPRCDSQLWSLANTGLVAIEARIGDLGDEEDSTELPIHADDAGGESARYGLLRIAGGCC